MIRNLSDLYSTISLQLPGVSAAVLDNEFRQAERRVCSDTGIWAEESTITTVADTYVYSVVLPANTDLVTNLWLKDTNDDVIDVNEYEIEFQESSNQDGYTVETLFGDVPEAIAGEYTDSGDTFNAAKVYKNVALTYVLYKAVAGINENSSLYILTSATEYNAHVVSSLDFPVDYYAATPPISAYHGLLDAEGFYDGRVRSTLFEEKASVQYTFEEAYIDGLSAYGAFTTFQSLTPRATFSAAPSSVLTQYADLITNSAFAELLRYPKNFPWSDPQKAETIDRIVRRLASKAKLERYRPNKRATLRMRSPSFL